MITGDLEYIICSLPHLSFQDADEERSKVLSIFRKYAGSVETEKGIIAILEEEARKFLGAKDYSVFERIQLDTIHKKTFQKSGVRVLSAFSTFVHSLKKDVQQLRISRKKGAGHTTKKPILPFLSGNPLEEETQLLKWQWDKLEELSIGHYSDFGALAIYKLKLQLLLRLWGFDQEKGFAIFLNSTKTH